MHSRSELLRVEDVTPLNSFAGPLRSKFQPPTEDASHPRRHWLLRLSSVGGWQVLVIDGWRCEANTQVRGQIGGCRQSGPVSPTEILDIFEGTQQIQQLIIARRLLGKTSAELK